MTRRVGEHAGSSRRVDDDDDDDELMMMMMYINDIKGLRMMMVLITKEKRHCMIEL